MDAVEKISSHMQPAAWNPPGPEELGILTTPLESLELELTDDEEEENVIERVSRQPSLSHPAPGELQPFSMLRGNSLNVEEAASDAAPALSKCSSMSRATVRVTNIAAHTVLVGCVAVKEADDRVAALRRALTLEGKGRGLSRLDGHEAVMHAWERAVGSAKLRPCSITQILQDAARLYIRVSKGTRGVHVFAFHSCNSAAHYELVYAPVGQAVNITGKSSPYEETDVLDEFDDVDY